ncbi:MAG: leucyl aminopeptidase family protein [Myxococcales bacterium]
MATPVLIAVPDTTPSSLTDARFDALVAVVTDAATGVPPLDHAIVRARALDARVGRDVVLVPADGLAGGRLIVAPTGPLTREYDDVRRFAEAARAGLERARDAGARAPLLWVAKHTGFPRALEAALLGALAGLWVPLEARESKLEGELEPVELIGVLGGSEEQCRLVSALEKGRRLARDLAGTEPERMRPEAFAASCVDAFMDTEVSLRVIDDLDTLSYQYPLLMAVARASLTVERHRPRVIHLEYRGQGPIERTLLLAGKGLTYDTGGADLKVGGHMAGMSRDKGGAAAVAGLMRALAELKPANVRVIGALGVVRNSIGADAFVSDEIITSHAGVRVRIGNTDAEGRLVLADLLSHLRVQALDAIDPHLLSVATLTGHAARAVGPYSILIENAPARQRGVASQVDALGEQWGDPFEISRLRREDFDFIKPRSAADDVLSCNNLPSSATARGHQFPAAFLSVASGLSQHNDSARAPLPFTHIDLGGSGCEGGDWQHGKPTASPVVPLSLWALNQL